MSDVRCSDCGTDHDGYPDDSLGARMRCLRAQAEAMGATHLIEQVDALRHDMDRRRTERLRCWLLDEL